MAHFAKLGLNNKVLSVQVVANTDTQNADGIEDESVGQNFLQRIHGWDASLWKRTSYNTHEGVHQLGGTPFRKNYAGIGFTYDEDRDAFIPPKPFPSWVLEESTCIWKSQITEPTTDEGEHKWDEYNNRWTERKFSDNNIYAWDAETETWSAI